MLDVGSQNIGYSPNMFTAHDYGGYIKPQPEPNEIARIVNPLVIEK